MKKGFTDLKDDIILLFTSNKSLEKKYKDDPDKVIELIKRRTKVRNKALIISAILAVLGLGRIGWKARQKKLAEKKSNFLTYTHKVINTNQLKYLPPPS